MLISERYLKRLNKVGQQAEFWCQYALMLVLYFSILGLALLAVVVGILPSWLRRKVVSHRFGPLSVNADSTENISAPTRQVWRGESKY